MPNAFSSHACTLRSGIYVVCIFGWRDNELAQQKSVSVQSAAEYLAQERESQASRFSRVEKKSVECKLIPFKSFAKVYRESDSVSFDDLRSDSNDRFSCWNPSQNFAAGWCSESNENCATDSNAKVGTRRLMMMTTTTMLFPSSWCNVMVIMMIVWRRECNNLINLEDWEYFVIMPFFIHLMWYISFNVF